MPKKFLRPEKREQIENKIKQNLQDLKNKNVKGYQYLLEFYKIIISYESIEINILDSDTVIKNWKKMVNSNKTMVSFLKTLPGLYSRLCIYVLENTYDGKDEQIHHLMPQHLYKKKNALVTKDDIEMFWNKSRVSSIVHLFLHLIRYIEYNNASDYQGVALGFRRGTKKKRVKLKFPSTGEEFKKDPFNITIYWLKNIFLEYPDFIENQINFLTDAGRNSGVKRLKNQFRLLFRQDMVWKSNHINFKRLIVIIPANFFKETLLVDLAVYLQQKCSQNGNNQKFSPKDRNNLKKKLSRYLNKEAEFFDGHYYLDIPSLDSIIVDEKPNQEASERASRTTSKSNVLKILDKLGGYQLVHSKCEIIVNIEPKKFNSVMQLANYCNQCCINLKKHEYILNKVQVQRFSKKLNNQLSTLPKISFNSMYNWILKPTKK